MADVQNFSPVRMTAATESAAVEQALLVVGASLDEVSVEVLASDARGVTVRVSPRGSEPAAAAPVAVAPAAAPVAPEAAAPAAQPEPVGNAGEDEDEAFDDADAGDVGDDDDDDDDDNDDDDDEAEEYAAGQEPREAAAAALPPAAPPRPIDPALQELALNGAQEMLDRMGMNAQAQLARDTETGGDSDVPRLMLEIEGEDVGILIGKHGQTLQAFQYLLNITLNNRLAAPGAEEGARENALRVIVDAGGYRSRRAGSLQQVARDAAQRALRDRRPIRMEPMPAHERRLVHMALQNDTSVATSSEGREPMRFVVITPAGYRAPEGGERGGNDRPSGGRGYGNRGGGGNGGGGSRGGFASGRGGNRGGFGSRGDR